MDHKRQKWRRARGARHRALRRFVLWTVVASLCVSAAVAIIALLAGDFDETDARIVITTASIALFSLLALPSGVSATVPRRRSRATCPVATSPLPRRAPSATSSAREPM
ncbi:MAG: hypothetical protein M3M94_06180 [Actinomycetota bacterium]|nr:hypothetical protein [Actinomycetota bacterium]